MQDNPIQPFDDPALKAALRRSLGQERAPAALRQRIGALAAQADPKPTESQQVDKNRTIPLYRRSPAYRWAVAAVFILGLGALAFQIWQSNQPPKYFAMPNSLYKGMVAAHEARLNHADGDSASTLAVAGALSKQIGRPVFVADLTKDGWKFAGASVRKVAGEQAAQLFFTKGNASISVFSLPSSATKGAPDGSTYAVPVSGAQIAGFVKGDGLFCIVGTSSDGSLKLDDVRQLLDTHQGELVKT